MHIPIEDFFEDIIGKAQRGLALSDDALAESASIGLDQLAALQRGEFDEVTARKLAPALGLDEDALVISGKKGWHPPVRQIKGVRQFTTPIENMTVNAYILWDSDSKKAAAFDTGADCRSMLEFAAENNLSLEKIFLTHTHHDHVADLDRLVNGAAHPPVYVNHREPVPDAELFVEGEEFEIGNLRVRTLPTRGHSAGGISFFVEGLETPVAVVGDALFAGSMGGGMVSYEDALDTNRRYLLTLPDATLICPGHGPMSSIGEEKAYNPFFPEFKEHFDSAP